MGNTEPAITIIVDDLTNEVLIDHLAALERDIRDGVGSPSNDTDDRLKRIVAAGTILAGEAWKRGLISARTDPA